MFFDFRSILLNMGEEEQILYMQVRLFRMFAERFNKTLKQTAELFEQYNVLSFIKDGFGIFHVESDEAVFEETKEFLESKGAAL